MTRRLRFTLIASLLGVCTAAFASPALADHHFMSIREFYPGTAANPNTRDDAFLELQMYTANQNVVGGRQVHVYGPTPDATAAVFTLSAGSVANPQNQRTVLIGGADVVGADKLADIGDEINPSGGAICFESQTEGSVDCVEWGTGSLANFAGTPVAPAGITDGQSITRKITPGCSTLLEQADDTQDSLTDFDHPTLQTPRNNAGAITESTCVLTATKAGAGSGIINAPGISCDGVTFLDCTDETEGQMVTLTATPTGGSTLNGWTGDCNSTPGNQCVINSANVDKNVTATFDPPTDTTLSVFRFGTGGGTVTGTGISCGLDCDETAANGWMATLTATPNATSRFAGWSNCPAPSGATCNATMTLNRTIGARFTEKIPPQTTITGKPRNRTRDRTPTFRFVSNEAGTFQCSIDGRAFFACSSPFTTRKLRRNRRHTFRVRARDRSGNFDASPAFDSFKVKKKRRKK